MKKLLISGYFVGMLLLTYVVVKGAATYLGEPVEINFRTLTHDLNDTEMDQHHFQREEHVDYVRETKLKETRTKKFFGWETKIDTLSVGYYKQTHNH